MNHLRKALCAAAATLVAPTIGFAQSNPAPTPSTTVSSVTVTATAERPDYRETTSSALNLLGERSVLNTPFSVSIFDQQLIENQQARSPLDVLKNDPSVLVTNTGLSLADTFSVRGFSLNNLANYRQDGGFLVNLANVPLEDKERVEVLKGLTGFLYGFTAPGGIINYVTKRPQDRPFLTVEGGVQNSELGYGHMDVNGRFGPSDQFGLRMNAVIEKGDLPVEGANLSRVMGSAAANWRIRPDLNFDVDYERQERRAHGLQDALILSAAVFAVPDAPKAGKLFGQEWETYDTDTENFGARLRWTPSRIWTFEVQARRSDLHRTINALTATLTNLNGTFTGAYSGDDQQRYLADTAQALATARFSTGPIKHELTFGWMGLDQSQYRGDFATAAVAVNNLYAPVQRPRPNVGTNLRGFQYRSLQQDQSAFLLSDTFTLGPVSLIAGVRHQDYKQVSYAFTGLTTATYDKTVDSPTVALIYKPWSWTSLYVSYAKGLEQGGTAPITAANAGEVLPPLESEQTEVGAKFDLRQNLTVTAAVFDINKGLEFIDPTSRRLVQSGEQDHQGFEINAAGTLFRDLSLVGGYTHLDAEAKNTGVAATTGKRPVNVPENVVSLYGEYRVRPLGGLTLSGAVRYVSDFAYDATNTRFAPDYSVVDLGVRYAMVIKGKITTLRLNVNNVAGENYWAGTAATALYIGAPRTVRLSVQAGF